MIQSLKPTIKNKKKKKIQKKKAEKEEHGNNNLTKRGSQKVFEETVEDSFEGKMISLNATYATVSIKIYMNNINILIYLIKLLKKIIHSLNCFLLNNKFCYQ